MVKFNQVWTANLLVINLTVPKTIFVFCCECMTIIASPFFCLERAYVTGLFLNYIVANKIRDCPNRHRPYPFLLYSIPFPKSMLYQAFINSSLLIHID